MTLWAACNAAGIGVVSLSEHCGQPRVHRALPALDARLVMSLDAPLEVNYGGRAQHLNAVVTGLMRPEMASPRLLLRPHQRTVYVELSLAAMQRLTRLPLHRIDAGGIEADQVLPWTTDLIEELADQPYERREQTLRVHLLDRLERADNVEIPQDVLESLKTIKAQHGRISVEKLARDAHVSPRHLRHLMRRSVGIGPKFASRVARLAAAVSCSGDGATSWAQIAAESGYHDQSHLVHDFSDLMATTPSAWLDEEGRNLQGKTRGAGQSSTHEQQ